MSYHLSQCFGHNYATVEYYFVGLLGFPNFAFVCLLFPFFGIILFRNTPLISHNTLFSSITQHAPTLWGPPHASTYPISSDGPNSRSRGDVGVCVRPVSIDTVIERSFMEREKKGGKKEKKYNISKRGKRVCALNYDLVSTWVQGNRGV